MRSRDRQIGSDLEERIEALSTSVGNLTPRVEFAEEASGKSALGQETEAVVREADDSSSPIEFITENGFSIVRPWESGGTPRPARGRCLFSVSDGFIEREITVEISRPIVTEITLRTRGRVELSSSFWICCAERHLANYVSEQADFPNDDELVVEKLDREDVLMALRWRKK
jgi:hypothetical protein